MDTSHTPSVKELKKELEHIDERTREKCILCRIILGIAMIIFVTVSVYALTQVYKKHNFKTIPLDPSLYPPLDPAVSEREMIELGQLFHPELSSTTKVRTLAPSPSDDKTLPTQ